MKGENLRLILYSGAWFGCGTLTAVEMALPKQSACETSGRGSDGGS